ncbi:MAG: sensor domain-containing protein [Chloroflexi bacterium]|nr:sensor domain-containing protein [Chloroflexota bacterium]
MTPTRQSGFFKAIIQPQTYLNILYLLLGLPLGIGYFVTLVTGIALGFGLLVIWVGVPILLLMFAISWALCRFERSLAVHMLHEEIPLVTRPVLSRENGSGLSTTERLFVGGWRRLKRHLSDRLTWTGMLYLLLRFPLGVATFTIAVTLVSVPIGMIFAPTYMWTSDPFEFSWIGLGDRTVDPFPWSWILTLIGIPLLFISAYLMNQTAVISGHIARLMLGAIQGSKPEPEPDIESEIEEASTLEVSVP